MRFELIGQLHRVCLDMPDVNALGAYPHTLCNRLQVVDQMVVGHIPFAELLTCFGTAHCQPILDTEPHALCHKCQARYRSDRDTRQQLVGLVKHHYMRKVAKSLKLTHLLTMEAHVV
jgi:hypothetical protein